MFGPVIGIPITKSAVLLTVATAAPLVVDKPVTELFPMPPGSAVTSIARNAPPAMTTLPSYAFGPETTNVPEPVFIKPFPAIPVGPVSPAVR
jgi:hypothetical protein